MEIKSSLKYSLLFLNKSNVYIDIKVVNTPVGSWQKHHGILIHFKNIQEATMLRALFQVQDFSRVR